MFTKDELLVIEDALKIADAEYIDLLMKIKTIKLEWLHTIESRKNYG